MVNNKVNIRLISTPTLVIFITFFMAKIFDKINWSWWWVFSPLWIPIFTALVIISVYILLVIITELWKR